MSSRQKTNNKWKFHFFFVCCCAISSARNACAFVAQTQCKQLKREKEGRFEHFPTVQQQQHTNTSGMCVLFFFFSFFLWRHERQGGSLSLSCWTVPAQSCRFQIQCQIVMYMSLDNDAMTSFSRTTNVWSQGLGSKIFFFQTLYVRDLNLARNKKKKKAPFSVDSVTAGIYPAAGPECRHGRRLYAHCPNYMHPYSTNVHTHTHSSFIFFYANEEWKRKTEWGGGG